MRSSTVALVVLVLALWAPQMAVADPPANDDFEHAATLTSGVAATGSNVEATAQDAEPVHSTWVAANRSVWFTWTAPQSGLARIDACGSAFDTVVAVYGGSTLNGIYATRIANNDDGCGAVGNDASLVFLRVQAGTTYRIALDGWTGSDAGEYAIVADMAGDPGPPPANDDVADAIDLVGPEAQATGTNVGATSGWNEWPSWATQLVWWRWVSPVDGQVRIDTCGSDFDTLLGVMRRDGGDWAGGDISGDGCGDRGAVSVNAVQGREYWIGVGGEAGSSGNIALRIDATPDVTAPTTTITSAPSSTWGRRVASFAWTVQDQAQTTSECSLDDEAWFDCAGGEQLEGLAEGEHVFRVRSTDQYGNAEAPGAERRFSVVIPQAANDDFRAALPLVPGRPVAVNNGKATAEPGEPSHDSWYYAQGLSANWSVWFAFTPSRDDVAELDWCDSGFDVTVAVYTGSAVDALTRVTQRDSGCQESFDVRGGVTYRVAVDGLARNLDYGTGPIALALAYQGTDSGVQPSPTTTAATGSATAPAPIVGSAAAAAEPVADLLLSPRRPARVRVDRRGRFAVRGARVRCAAGPACAVRVTVLARRGRRILGTSKLRVEPGHRLTVRAKLRRSARSLLARRGRLPVRVRLHLSPQRKRTVPVTLVAARR
jgi:hypothetical protein